MAQKQKLELTWIGKENRPRLEPRILLEDAEKSYHAAERVGENDIFDNKLIFGDNLLALKALEQEFAGKVKCIYIDPPFNTGQALPNYDDGLEHSIWLTLMRNRLDILHKLLAEDGALFVHIDDNELGYLIVVLDEILGRRNRVSIVTFKQGSATGHKSINPGVVSTSNFVAIYAKNKADWVPNRVFTRRVARDKRYGTFIQNPGDHFANWKFIALAEAFAFAAGIPRRDLKRKLGTGFEDAISDFVMKYPRQVVRLARPDYDAVSEDARRVIDESKTNETAVLRLVRPDFLDMYFLRGERILFYSDKLKLVDGSWVAGEPLTSIWDDVLSNNLHNEGGVDFPKGKKPEALIKRCLELCTHRGDLVLDSFAGSGTTAAVAHKMGRRWISVELREQCDTHIVPRLKRVIEGRDKSGVTDAVAWRGGGGFRYYRLAPSLLEKDRYGRAIISKEFNAAMLAEAMCKLMGFRYEPSQSVYWQQGKSTEADFIFVTTQSLSAEQLEQLSDEVGSTRSLLICGTAFRARAQRFPNIELKKIPAAVLQRCEWGKDDYSLKVENLPAAAPAKTEAEQMSLLSVEAK